MRIRERIQAWRYHREMKRPVIPAESAKLVVEMLKRAEPATLHTQPAPAQPQPSITCPKCGRTSYSPGDIEHRYCGACHQFHDEMVPTPPPFPENEHYGCVNCGSINHTTGDKNWCPAEQEDV